MRKSRLVYLAAAAASSSILSSIAQATSYQWASLAGGTYNWTDAPNWNPNTGFPIGASGAGDSANLNVATTGSLLVNVAAGSYFVNTLQVGSTGGAFTTDIGNGNSGGGVLVLDGGSPNLNHYADVKSLGAAGSTNIISAPIEIDQASSWSGGTINGVSSNQGNYDFNATGVLSGAFISTLDTDAPASIVFDKNSTNSITVSGPITQAATVTAFPGAIYNAMTGPNTLTLSGPISVTNSAYTNGTLTTGQTMVFAGAIGSTTVISGSIGDGEAGFHSAVTYGVNNPSKVTVYPAIAGTIVLDGAATYTGITTLNLATLVLGNDQAFGAITTPTPGGGLSGEVRTGAAVEYGYTLESDNDARTIANGIKITETLGFAGSHSLTLTGYMYQSANREVDNDIIAGKSLNLNGITYIASDETNRTFIFDGTGLTLVGGAIENSIDEYLLETSVGVSNANGALTKNGTGTVRVTATTSTYRGATTVNGGLLEFATPGSYGVQPLLTPPAGGGAYTETSGLTVTAGGTVALDANALATRGSTDQTFINLFSTGSAVSTGSLALTSTTLDGGVNIDYTGTVGGAANLSNANAAGLSIGAAGNPVTYTGTITPATSGTFANTYRLGGGNTTLTLANANALSGANSLVVTNGGSVDLANSNSYSGSTVIKGVYVVSDAAKAAAADGTAPGGGFEPVTLSVGQLGNGLAVSGSSLGSSSNVASNLVISGATLQYNGSSSASTDRLFTISPLGATLDSSGSGAVAFTNPGAIVESEAGTAANTTVGATSASNTFPTFNRVTGIADTSNLAIGMSVTDSDGVLAGFAQPVTIIGIDNSEIWLNIQPQTGFSVGSADTLTFGNQNRALNLTGTNTGLNILTPALTDSATGKLTVNKSGAGTWSINGANTYTGGTNVTGGTLVIGANGALPANSVVNIGSGAEMQLGSNTGLATVSSLNIAAGGTLDMSNDHMIVTYGASDPASTIYNELKSGFNAAAVTNPAAWTGTGIDSSVANLSANRLNYGVGMVDGKDGVPGALVTSGQILIAYALYGDLNLDNLVNATDFAVFGVNFNTAQTGWDKGDFLYNGLINASDFALLGTNFGKAASGVSLNLPAADFAALDAFAAANGLSLPSVPEPATGALALLAGAGALLRRSRRDSRRAS